MPFLRETPNRPQRIGDIAIVLRSPAPIADEPQPITVTAHISVIMDNGNVRVREIDLGDHLSAQRLTSLRTFMDDIRTKANAEILPEEITPNE
jgi:hypothetical protein